MDLIERIRQEMAFEGNIWKSYVYRFLMNFQLWWPIWVVYLQQTRGLSLAQITLLDTPFFLVILLSEVPTGAVADRFGRKTSLMIGSALFAVAIFVFGIADSYPIILVSYTSWGLAVTFQSGADQAILYDSLKRLGREGEYTKINGRLWALSSFAVVLAILLGAPIGEATSLPVPIILSAGIALCAIPVAFSMHEPRHEHEEVEPYFQMVGRGIADAWRRPSLRYVIMYGGVLNAATFVPLIFTQPFLVEHGVGIASFGLWQAPVRAAGIVASLAAARVVGGIGRRTAFFAMPLALGLSYFFLAGLDTVVMYAMFLPIGVIAGIQNPVLATYMNERIPSARRATMLSVQGVVNSILLAGIEPATGLIADNVGLRAVFLASGLAAMIVAPAILILWNRAEAVDSEVAAEEGEGVAKVLVAS